MVSKPENAGNIGLNTSQIKRHLILHAVMLNVEIDVALILEMFLAFWKIIETKKKKKGKKACCFNTLDMCVLTDKSGTTISKLFYKQLQLLYYTPLP